MNQPRYRDNADSGDNWRNNDINNRQRSTQGTGRSNYGGRRNANNSNSNNNNPLGQAIGNWISNRKSRRLHHQQRTTNRGEGRTTTTTTAPVGTEANAIQNMARNALHFSYPPSGFVTPIEHSLLYAMIEYPERYPEQVVKNEIEDEEFEMYLYVKEDEGSTHRKSNAGRRDDDNDRRGEQRRGDNNDDEHDDEEKPVSYAQLSALLSLSAEKNPASPQEDQQQSQATTNTNASTATSSSSQLSIGQALCKKLLKTITRYSDTHNLDRQTEIAEFLSPVERRCQIRTEKAALQQLLPAYAGYTLSLMTGNPLPLLIGVVALTSSDPMVEETNNVSGFSARAGRSGQMETAGLLDECDSD
jgi:hypothetical protein